MKGYHGEDLLGEYEHSGLAIWKVNKQGEVLMSNAFFESYKIQSALQKRTIDLYRENKFQKLQSINNHVLLYNYFEDSNSGIFLNTEKEVWYYIHGNFVEEDEGKNIIFTAIESSSLISDIKGSLLAEEIFSVLTKNFESIVFQMNDEGSLKYLRPKSCVFLGYTSEELLNNNFFSLFKVDPIIVEDLKYSLSKTKTPVNEIIILKNKEGNNVNCNLNAFKSGMIYNCIIRDLDFIVGKEEEYRMAKETAENALSIKEKFIANMSHEIRTPLNSIKGLLHIFDTSNFNENQKEQYSTIRKSVRLLSDLINDLLDFSKIEAGKMSAQITIIDLPQIFNYLEELYLDLAEEKNIKLIFENNKNLPKYIYSDGRKIIQVYSNLISNALKFTEEGGKIVVSLNMESSDSEKTVFVGKVIDNGIGIREKDQKDLFLPFHQVDDVQGINTQGTGLGLSIVKELLETLGGNISLSSVFGEGTEIEFTFLADVYSDQTFLNQIDKKRGLDRDNRWFDNVKVLVVDDNKINQEIVSHILNSVGCIVKTCSSGFEAIEIVEDEQFNLIFMDVQMPGIDGITTAGKIKKNLKEKCPPIIVMTAYTLEESVDLEKNLGFNDYLPKPIEPDKLVDLVEKYFPKNNNSQNDTIQNNGILESDEIIDKQVVDNLLKYGDKKMIIEAFEEFILDTDIKLNEAYLWAESKNIKEILSILHALKGNSSTLGIKKFAYFVLNLEKKFKQQEIFDVITELDILKSAFHDFKEYYNNEFKSVINI